MDQRLDAYAELVCRYARNSVSLEHAHMVNRGSDDGYLEIVKLKLRARKIVNRMDKVIAVIMQVITYRQQAHFQTYPKPAINPINQMITSPAEADKIGAAALQEAEEIMAIAYPSGTQPPAAITDTATTQTAHTVPPTASTAMTAATAATAANCLDRRKQPRPALPSFTMNAIPDNRPGVTANPLLVVNMGNDGNINSFITPTLATNHQDNRNTVAFDNNIPKADKQINARLAEIANQGPPSESTATNHHDHPVPDRCQFTNHSEQQYQSIYTNQNRSYTNNYN